MVANFQSQAILLNLQRVGLNHLLDAGLDLLGRVLAHPQSVSVSLDQELAQLRGDVHLQLFGRAPNHFDGADLLVEAHGGLVSVSVEQESRDVDN